MPLKGLRNCCVHVGTLTAIACLAQIGPKKSRQNANGTGQLTLFSAHNAGGKSVVKLKLTVAKGRANEPKYLLSPISTVRATHHKYRTLNDNSKEVSKRSTVSPTFLAMQKLKW